MCNFFKFQSYYSLISNMHSFLIWYCKLFQSYYSLISNEDVDFCSDLKSIFQSYYSLISNFLLSPFHLPHLPHFNPIIVLFLTWHDFFQIPSHLFQSYYSLISNIDFCFFTENYNNFNPIIVLFLTTKNNLKAVCIDDFNPIIVLFLTLL